MKNPATHYIARAIVTAKRIQTFTRQKPRLAQIREAAPQVGLSVLPAGFTLGAAK